MSENRLLIASAGSGKTTQIVDEALSITNGNVLITTYTQANEREIKKKIIQKKKSIPSNITIQTWFSFLIQHGVKPYQGVLNDEMFEKRVKGLLLTQGESGVKYRFKRGGRFIPVRYNEEEEFQQHYFSKEMKIYSDKLSKFVDRVNIETGGEVISRISRIFSNIFIDEVQDLAGYDLELIKQLFKSDSRILLVGDPRQVTYLTHLESKNRKYRNGRIKDFLVEKCKSLIKDGIDEESLKYSHRNNEMICKYSSLLYPDLPESVPCKCCERIDTGHDGVFLIHPDNVEYYLDTFNPLQLRWNSSKDIDQSYPVMNFGESKGLTFDRVLIYPTKDMLRWIQDSSVNLSESARAKFYVGLTRAKFSAAIVFNFDDKSDYPGLIKFR